MTTDSAADTRPDLDTPFDTRPTTANPALYRFLVEILPSYMTRLDRLDVPRLSESLGLSRQGIYRWFVVEKLTPKNARRLCELANSDENVAALDRAGRLPPAQREFDRFVYVG